jgi:hypothetical protein
LRMLVCKTKRNNKPLLLDLMDKYGVRHEVSPNRSVRSGIRTRVFGVHLRRNAPTCAQRGHNLGTCESEGKGRL